MEYLFAYRSKDGIETVEVSGKEKARETAERVGEGLVFKDEKMYFFKRQDDGEFLIIG